MKYLCLAYHEEAKLDALSRGDHAELDNESVEFNEQLRASGHLIASARLQPVQTATTIRVRHGKMSIIDGPFAETTEQLGGFFLIEATDLNDAIRVASRMPPARLGSVEVRPIMEPGACNSDEGRSSAPRRQASHA